MVIMNVEIKEKIDIRSVTLIVLFILIFLCILISVSYSYYTTTAVDKTNFFAHNIVVSCLNITKQSEGITLPTSARPVTKAVAMADNYHEVSGLYNITIKNNCAAEVRYNIRFVPDSSNEINLNAIGISSCANTLSSCESGWSSAANRLLGATVGSGSSIDQCYTTSTHDFWNRLGTDNGIGGSDQRICPAIKGTTWGGNATVGYDGYKTIAASGTANYSFKFYIDSAEGGTSGSTLGKRFSGKFVVYSVY